MKKAQSNIALISTDKNLIHEWTQYITRSGRELDCYESITPQIINQYKVVYLDLVSNLSHWRSFKKMKVSPNLIPVLIVSGKTASNPSFGKIFNYPDQFLILQYPFNTTQINKHLTFLDSLTGDSQKAEEEGVLTYQIVAKLNEIFDSIVLGQPEPLSYNFIKKRMVEILSNFLKYDYIFLGRKSGLYLQFKAVVDNLQYDFPMDEIMSIDEFLQMLNYKTPILKNNLNPDNRIYQTILNVIDPDVKHILIIPAKSLEGEDVLWILLKKSATPISSFDFYLTHFMIKSFFVWYMFMQKTEIDLFKWDRYKTMKKDIALFRNIFDAFQFGLFLIDQSFTIRFANKKASEILNKDLNDLEGQPLSRAFTKENFELIEQNLKIGQKEYRGEFEITVNAEQTRFIGFSFYPSVEIDNQDYLLLIFKDITDLKLLEEENLRNDRLATLGIIASEIAHEIRNPLAGIRAIAETLKDEMEDHPTIAEYTDRIIRQSERMEALIKNLFTYTKPPRPNLTLCNLPDLIDEVRQLLDEKLKKKKIKFHVQISPSAQTIYADANQIQQVFLNVIQNSIDSIEADGKIEISVFKAESIPEKIRPLLQAWESEKIIKIIVKDNGKGISPEAMSKLFLPFFTTKEEGIGLGLSIVYQIIKEHRGYITYESEIGEGTECHIFLPQYKNHLGI